MSNTVPELEYIRQFDNLYPGIDLWMKNKVLSQPEKRLWALHDSEGIAGLSIVDIVQGKLCHLSATDRYHQGFRYIILNFLYTIAVGELKARGFTEIFAHGTPEIISWFCNLYPDWKIVGDAGNFGRGGEPDQMVKLDISRA